MTHFFCPLPLLHCCLSIEASLSLKVVPRVNNNIIVNNNNSIKQQVTLLYKATKSDISISLKAVSNRVTSRLCHAAFFSSLVFSVPRPSRKLHMQMQPSYSFLLSPSPHALKPCFVCLFPWTPWRRYRDKYRCHRSQFKSDPIGPRQGTGRHGIQSRALFVSCSIQLLVPDLFSLSCVYVCSVRMQASHFLFLPPSYKCGAIFSPDHIFLFFYFFSSFVSPPVKSHSSSLSLSQNSFASSSFPSLIHNHSLPFHITKTLCS